jgi:hypothetical protein
MKCAACGYDEVNGIGIVNGVTTYYDPIKPFLYLGEFVNRTQILIKTD